MRARVALAAALLLVLSLLTGGTALATDDTDQHNDQALYFLTRTVEEEATFEGEPEPGDQFFFEEVVFESNADMEKGQRVGRGVGIVTLSVTGGQIDVAASFDDGADQLFFKDVFFQDEPESRTFDVALVGGTGQYEGATGAATVTELNRTSFVEVRIDD
jgi:hypothetical protein